MPIVFWNRWIARTRERYFSGFIHAIPGQRHKREPVVWKRTPFRLVTWY